MKVKTQNLKIQFLSQLRKHLKSPNLNKILNPKKCRKRRQKLGKNNLQSSQFHKPTSLQSSSHKFQIKTIRKAGEKLKQGFRKDWDSDVIAQKRTDLLEYALRKKVITASSVVTADDIKKPSTTTEKSDDSSEPCSSSSAEVEVSNPPSAFFAKDYYLDCSSTDSSPKPFLLYNQHDDSANKDHNYEISSQFKEPDEDGSNVLSCSQSLSKATKINVEARCLGEINVEEQSSTSSSGRSQNPKINIAPEPEVCLPRMPAIESDHASSSTNHQRRFPCSSSVTAQASVFLNELKKFVDNRSCNNTPATQPGTGMTLAPSSSHCDVTPAHDPEFNQQSYSASLLSSKQALSDVTNREREFASENISFTRSNLFHHPHNLCHTRVEKKKHFRYLHEISSDSDSSDDEILTRIKRRLKHEDAVTEQFFSRNRRSSWLCHNLSDSDSSSDSTFNKPFFRH